MIDSVMGSGLSAVYKGQETAVSAANKIARAGTGSDSDGDNDGTRGIAEGAVELKQAEHLVKAGAKVIQAADSMIGSLFDAKA